MTPGPTLGVYREARLLRLVASRAVVEAADPGRGPVVSAVWTVEADREAEVLDLAATIPAARLGGVIELRPAGIYW